MWGSYISELYLPTWDQDLSRTFSCGKSRRDLCLRELLHSSWFGPEEAMLTLTCAQGSSHQIFHVLILLAAMSQLISLLTAFHYARTSSKC